VEALAGYGVREDEIGEFIGVDPKTLRKHYRQELRQGHTKANAKVAENLYRRATGEGREAVTAAIFWLKTRAGWKESDRGGGGQHPRSRQGGADGARPRGAGGACRVQSASAPPIAAVVSQRRGPPMTTKAAILSAIRQKCLDCSCQQPSEVRACHITECALWPYRFGRDPAPSGNRGFAGPAAGRSVLQSRSSAMPSPPRLNAASEKPHVYTCGSPHRQSEMGPGSTPPRALAESSVYRDDFEQGEHLPSSGSVAEDVR
jgi:hypothetical protein